MAEFFKIFRSYFGQWDDFIFSFCNFLTFKRYQVMTFFIWENNTIMKNLILNGLYFLGDGCIFVWRLPQEMTATMLNRLSQLESASPAKSRVSIAMEPSIPAAPGSAPTTTAAAAATAAQTPPPLRPMPPPQVTTPSSSLQPEETFSSSIPDVAPPMTPADNDYR